MIKYLMKNFDIYVAKRFIIYKAVEASAFILSEMYFSHI